MRIGVLRTGDVNPALVPKHGEYVDMFAALLAPHGVSLFEVDVVGGAALPRADAAEAWLVTGSRHGVYDDLPWIAPLRDFLRGAVGAGVPVIGVCFGHQILAEAMGGRAELFPGGWQLGPKRYDTVADLPGWAAPLAGGYDGLAVHQDQVTEVPPGARVIATGPDCAHAALIYGDPQAPCALSVQSHPEFTDRIVADLIDARLAEVIPAERVAAAREEMGRPLDNAAWAEVMIRFLGAARAGRAAG